MGQQNQRFVRRILQQNVPQRSSQRDQQNPNNCRSHPHHNHPPQDQDRARHQVDSDMNRNNNTSASLPEKLDITDVRDPSEISQLTAKQLKIILTRNCVDFKGVFEKEVLREKVMLLWIDCNEKKNTRNPISSNDGSQYNTDDIDEKNACKICMEREINCVLLECGHMLTCIACGRKLAECPICRQNITRCVRTFKG